jgi:hypothetical protein
VIVAFAVADVGDKDATPVEDGMTGTPVEIPEDKIRGGALVVTRGGALVVGPRPDEELDVAAVGRVVGVSETRTPVKLYDAAQAARDSPCTG